MRLPAPIDRAPWPAAAAVISAAMLATAHVFQAMGYAPCNLCLRQREAYWGAIAVAVVGLVLVGLRQVRPQVVSLLLAAVFLVGAFIAAFHSGVEWKWWPGPASCVSGGLGSVSLDDLSSLMDGSTRIRPPSCDEAAWRLFGLSMAGWNALASLGLAGISTVFALRREATS